MQELNYLKDKVITPGAAPFVSHATYPVNDGHADLWLYDIFPGVQLMVTDFACETCFQDGMEQDVIGIHHCARGRFECVFDHWNYVYMGEGDIALNSMLHPPIGASFPLKDYFGSTIILYPQTCDDVPELAGLGISAREIFRKYSLAEHCRVFRRNEAVEHVYRELYGNLAKPQLTFLRLKLLELLYHIQADQTVFEENCGYLPKALTEKIKHVKDHMLQNEDGRISLKELAAEHEISLTQLKAGFKQIYGETPYAYLRSYKMHCASQRLLETDLQIGEIALELGYQNPSKFAQASRAIVGCTPAQYRSGRKNK